MKIEILVAAVALIAAGNVAAQGCMPWVEVFAAADTDYGDRLTKDKCDHHVDAGKFLGFNPRFRNHFTDIDADKNGELMKDEMTAGMQTMPVTDEDVVTGCPEGLSFQSK